MAAQTTFCDELFKKFAATDKMRIQQRGFVVLESDISIEGLGCTSGFGENDFARGRIPFVGVRCPEIDLHTPFGQHAELEGAALFDHFGIGVLSFQPGDVFEGLLGIV